MTQTDDARELPDRIYACLSNSSKTGITVLRGHANEPVSRWQPYTRADLAPTPLADPRVVALAEAVREAQLQIEYLESQIEYLDGGSPQGTSQEVLARINAALAAFNTGGKDE